MFKSIFTEERVKRRREKIPQLKRFVRTGCKPARTISHTVHYTHGRSTEQSQIQQNVHKQHYDRLHAA